MITVSQTITLAKPKKGRKRIQLGDSVVPVRPRGSVPRISRLMALAIKYQGMLDRGEVFPTHADHRLVVLNVDMKTRPDRSH